MPEISVTSGSETGRLELACGRLFDEVPCYISIQDREFQVIEANRTLIDDFGDPLYKKCYAVYKGRSERCPECPVARTFEDGKDHSSEETMFDRRGLPRDVVVKTRPLRDHTGKIVAVMELFTDITVQKELERRLHDSVTRFHNLFDLVPCYITVHSRDFRILEANQRFKESFGDRPGAYCYELYKHRTERCPKCPVADTFEDGRPHTIDEALVDAFGKEGYVAVHTAPIRDAQGNITAVIKVADDITELRMLQDKLASLGRLVGGIAHSIKNVLEGLRGGVYVVNLGFRDNNQEDIRTGWQMVERNVGRISSMIMDMLYCAKERSPRRIPVSLPQIAREVTELFTPRANDYSILLQSEIAPGDITIAGEPKDIHALLSNLITNAIDACLSDQSEGKSHRIVLRLYREGGHAVIEVEDNGSGMDEETRAKLFTMFFSTKGTFGTGLGLLVSHKVVSEHGGTIAVKSAPGEGATFTVRLPIEAKS